MKKNLVFNGVMMLLPVAVLAMMFAAIVYVQQTLEYEVVLVDPVTVHVEAGSRFNTIVQQLEAQNLLIRPRIVAWYGRLSGIAHKMQAGEYRFQGQVRLSDVLRDIRQGDVVHHQLTLVEGHTFAQWLQQIQRHDKIQATLDVDQVESIQSWFSEVSSVHQLPSDVPEGWFFPDTYQFLADTPDVVLLRRAFDKMQAALDALWPHRAKELPYKTVYEALIMASIIEKETGIAQERARISGVFINRLRKPMRLQTDPTVIYGLGDRFDGNLTRAHLRQSTPYNTYVIPGLPPTPIAMPSLAAIQAALHPESHQFLYFVAKGDGAHVFSKNLKAHNKAVRRYQLR